MSLDIVNLKVAVTVIFLPLFARGFLLNGSITTNSPHSQHNQTVAAVVPTKVPVTLYTNISSTTESAVSANHLCENKLSNCAEYDSGNLCTDDAFYTWAYDNCKGYCKFDICNDSWCEDSKGANCQLLDSALNLCSDIPKAKQICRKYCNICNVTDGKWCSWGPWNNCDATCGNGTKIRTRQCACPKPQNGGSDCVGDYENSTMCSLDSCPVHGGWSTWSDWGTCSTSCGVGLRRRDRHCNNPRPSLFGDHCFGDSNDYDVCAQNMCTSGNWTEWGLWGACSVTCGVGLRRRERNCTVTSFLLQACVGDTFENKICTHTACQGQILGTVVNGDWSSWSSWSSCSEYCGVTSMKTRTRTCTHPSPSQYGRACIGNSEDKDICDTYICQSSVRLVNGTHRYEGRVEVYHNGAWGTVCDDGFSDLEARVVCRMLNLPWGGVHVYNANHFGKGTLPILLDDVDCSGSERSLSDCTHGSWGANNCGHDEDVGVSCLPKLHIRLAGGNTSHSGRVEVSVDGSHWGTVCDDAFSSNAAKVVCRMLDYPELHAHTIDISHGSGPTFLDQVNCTGSEASLLLCKHNRWGEEDCSHDEDVGVVCI